MKLKDILELGTYGFNPECKVEIFNMDNFEEHLENEAFEMKEYDDTIIRRLFYLPLCFPD